MLRQAEKFFFFSLRVRLGRNGGVHSADFTGARSVTSRYTLPAAQIVTGEIGLDINVFCGLA